MPPARLVPDRVKLFEVVAPEPPSLTGPALKRRRPVRAAGVAPGRVPTSVVLDPAASLPVQLAIARFDFLSPFAVVFVIGPLPS